MSTGFSAEDLWAYRNHLENRARATQARAEQRRITESRRAERRRETAQDKSVALKGSRGLSADELDSQTGHLRWPEVLQATAFADVHSQLDALFVERALRPGQESEIGLQIQRVTNEFRKRLKAMIRELPAKDFIAGDKFLERISYDIRYDGGVRPKAAIRYAGLGEHTRPVTTTSREAQKYFEQGLAFMYAYNHDEALRAFQRAVDLDPQCAMAHWGASLSMGKNYNYPFFPPEKAKAAWKSLQLAQATSKNESEANRALIEALAARYADPLPEDTRPLEEAYAQAMKAVSEKFPKDADIGALYAESLMNLRPWDLWTVEGKPQPETPAILKALETVLEFAPNHLLANHLYIHACEASPYPEKADAAADRLRDMQPALGHMVHMPSHIDIRRGRWQAAIEANEKAIVADRHYAKTVPEQGFYRMYMAHNHSMLVFAAMNQGESQRALTVVRDMLADVAQDWVAKPENAAVADGFVAAPMEVMKRFGKWDEILKEPEPPEIFPIARAMRHHIRAVAYAAKGETAQAREEQNRFREAAKRPAKDVTFGNNKAADLFAVGDDMLEGEILVREGKMEAGIKALQSAVAKEDKLRYSEPPDWAVPVRHALGTFLLHDGQNAEAEAVYREDLRRWPDNGWSLHGLSASLAAQGKKTEAAKVRARFDESWKHADVKITSSCFCQK